ncbi:MAG: phosphate acyltransferase [Caldilineaceae bacterium]
MNEATEIVKRARPDLLIDGEMQADMRGRVRTNAASLSPLVRSAMLMFLSSQT